MIKNGTKFRANDSITYKVLNGTLRMLGENGTISGYADCYDLIKYTFELIEEQQDIDIQELKERIEKLEKKIDRFEYFAKRVEEMDSQKGIFRYC